MEITTTEAAPVASHSTQMLAGLPSMMETALKAGESGVQALERLVALQRELRADLAREAFFVALGEFQANCPTIKKNRTASIRTKGGGSYSYKYADFARIVDSVREAMRAQGLSYSFDTSQDAGTMTVVCKLRHTMGHMELTTFSCPMTSLSSGASDQQVVGGTMTFAKRYALSGALGLATADDDHDGRGGCAVNKQEDVISEKEANGLLDRIHAVGADLSKFLRYYRIDRVEDLPKDQLDHAHDVLDRREAEQEIPE